LTAQQLVECGNTSALVDDQTSKCASSKLYVTSQLDGIDVITRRYPARQHNVGTVSSPTHRRCERVTGRPQLPAQLFKRHGSKPIPPVPALHHWHAGRQRVYTVSHARRTAATQDHPAYIKIVYLQRNSCCPVPAISNAFPLQV